MFGASTGNTAVWVKTQLPLTDGETKHDGKNKYEITVSE